MVRVFRFPPTRWFPLHILPIKSVSTKSKLGSSDQLSSNFPMLSNTHHGLYLKSLIAGPKRRYQSSSVIWKSWKVYPLMKKYQVRYLAMAFMPQIANEYFPHEKFLIKTVKINAAPISRHTQYEEYGETYPQELHSSAHSIHSNLSLPRHDIGSPNPVHK